MKWIGGLIGLYLVVLVTVLVVALAVPGSAGGAPDGSFSHAQLDADRLMTQQMAIDVTPGMASSMGSSGMLQRSFDPGYIAALEQHIAQFDRSMGISSIP